MVDRPFLIKALAPIAKTTSSQAENIRKALEKALVDIVLALPLAAAQQLGASEKSELGHFVTRLDPKALEKLAKAWEPNRKLDADLKKSLPADLVALLESKRHPYSPIKMALDVARSEPAAVVTLLSSAPIKDLTAVLKSWDKHFKPIPEQRSAVENRLRALLGGEPPASPPAKVRGR